MRPIIAFDLDGTLVDSLPDIQWALNTTLSEAGFPGHGLDAVRAMVGHGLASLVHQALPVESRGHERERVLVARIKELYLGVPYRDSRPYPGMGELIARLRDQGAVLGVLTNKAEPIAKLIVEHFFPGIFTAVRGEAPGLPRKPDPEALRLLLTDLAEAAGRAGQTSAELARDAILCGDSEADIQTALAAGARAIAVGWGYREAAALAACGPEAVAADAAELERILNRRKP